MTDDVYQSPDDRLFSLMEILARGLVYYFAAFTLCYQAALFAGFSFRTFTWVSAVATACLFIGFLVCHNRALARDLAGNLKEPRALVFLAAMAIAAGALSLLTVRSDPDDVGHLARAVYHFDNPGKSLNFAHIIAFSPETAVSFSHLTSHEHLAASLALVLGLKPVQVYHQVMSAVGGALIPIAWFLVIRRLTDSNGAALTGVLAVLLLLCVDGTVHRSPGNFGLVRIWQGKAMLFNIVVPLCVAYMPDSLESFSPWCLLRLLCLSVCGLGLSTSAVFLLPIVYCASAGSWCLVHFSRQRVCRALVGAIFASSYLVAAGLFHYARIKAQLQALGNDHNPYPYSLGQAWNLVFGWIPGLSGSAALIGLLLLICLKKWRLAAWLTLWSVLILAPFSLSSVATWVADQLTSRWVFWRVVYALPIPLTVGLAVASVFSRFSGSRNAFSLVAGFAFASVAILGLFRVAPSPWANSLVDFPAFRLKLSASDLAASSHLAETLAPGEMLACRTVSSTLPLFTSRLPQAIHRGHSDLPERAADVPDLALRFASGETQSEKAFTAFTEVIARPYRYVVTTREVAQMPNVLEKLRGAGYAEREALTGGLVVFQRSGSSSDAASAGP